MTSANGLAKDGQKAVSVRSESLIYSLAVPALTMAFGEEFRPVKLERYCYGYAQHQQNDFNFDHHLNNL
jgi:hypothetical protein